MKMSTVIGGGIVFVTGVCSGVYLTCKAVVKIDEKIYKGKLREKFVEATTEITTSFIREKFESKRFEPKRFECSRFDVKYNQYCPQDVIFSTRADAEETLLKLNDYIEAYGQASIADLRDLIGDIAVYTDNQYGWKRRLDDVLIIRIRDGYVINFPKTCEL